MDDEHSRFPALVAEYGQAPARFVPDPPQPGCLGDQSCHVPTEPMRMLSVPGAYVGSRDERANGTEALCVIGADLALQAFGSDSFYASQAATAIRDEDARITQSRGRLVAQPWRRSSPALLRAFESKALCQLAPRSGRLRRADRIKMHVADGCSDTAVPNDPAVVPKSHFANAH